MTGRPSNNTKISLIGLGVLGVSALAAILYNIDKWLANGMAVKRIATTCSGLGTGCSDAFTSMVRILGNPPQLLISLAITAFAIASIKALLVVTAARKAAARYSTPGHQFERLHSVLVNLRAGDMRVRVADDGVSAFTYGIIKPTICLSRNLIDRLSDSELTALVAHEIGHVKRRDNLAIFIALFIRDFLWPLPISHHLFAVFVREKEYAADDFAVGMTKNPLDLAAAIVSVAKAVRNRKPFSPAYAAFFPGKATAKARINRLLNSGEKVKPSLLRLLVSLLLSVVMIVTIVGFAYGQTPIKGKIVEKCGMSKACIEQNFRCCK